MCGADNCRLHFLIACDAMLSTANPTALKLLDACEHVLCEVEALEDVTVRRVAGEANANPSAISYHFGSQKPPAGTISATAALFGFATSAH